MKLRTGHVSNSSSSSFIVYGGNIDQEDVIILAERLGMSQSFIGELQDYIHNDEYKLSSKFQSGIQDIQGYEKIEFEYKDGEFILGVVQDIESFTPEMMVSGIASKETITAIDSLLEMVGSTSSCYTFEECC